MNIIKILSFVLILAGCSIIVGNQFDNLYGPAHIVEREKINPKGPDFFSEVKPILDRRCVVCHACYDAPCQLKLSSPQGIDRGASKTQVYLAARLFAANPTRLFIDASNTKEWRKKDFFPILNERSPAANLAGSTMLQMLELKRKHDHENTKILSNSYDFSLDRKQQCPQIEEFEKFSKKYPLWGMPYGFPKLEDKEHQILKDWIANGAQYRPEKLEQNLALINKWEKFFNGTSKKEALMSRYIYEHLFLANLYFKDQPKLGYYRLVRSKTPPGQPIKIIATRRPYDSPGGNFYYRLWPEESTRSAKIHMPYNLDNARVERWQQLFLNQEYEVHELPGYSNKIAANPFKAFADIPANSRYRFMLDEAEFTVMGFIKGPVCRGNTAVNVIEDRFWVMFVNPNSPKIKDEDIFIKEQIKYLRLPTEEASNSFVFSTWLKYSALEKKYLKTKEAKLKENFKQSSEVGLDLLWDGEGKNSNSGLTIFRNNDSATVVKGFIGSTPKTAWVIGYPLLERIHYLLVAGFDIYGNVGHQLNARLFMDFMRMEGEYNFLTMLPQEDRIKERNFWYRDANKNISEYLNWSDQDPLPGLDFKYQTKNHKAELLLAIKKYLAQTISSKLNIESYRDQTSTKLSKLENRTGLWVPFMPPLSMLRVKSKVGSNVYTIIRDSGYSNVATPLSENDRRLPKEDKITLVKGIIGSYPNAFYDVDASQLDGFIETVTSIKTESDYALLMDRFGIRRSNKEFWKYSDWINSYYFQTQPVEAGYLDYNRYENR